MIFDISRVNNAESFETDAKHVLDSQCCKPVVFAKCIFYMSHEAVKKIWPLFMGFFPQMMDDKLDPWCFLVDSPKLRINPQFWRTPFI